MKRDGLLELLHFDGAFQWHFSRFGCTLNVAMIEQGITISYRDRNGCDIDSLVPMVRTNCHIKGSRPWFSCPECGRRVAILYAKDVGKFACRKCQRLAYPSQSEGAENRSIRRYNKIRRRLGWKPGFLNGYGDKPTGMHWRNFEILKADHDAFVNASLA